MKNLKDLKTTIPTVAAIISALLGISGIIDDGSVPMANELLVTLGFTVLSFVGLFSRA